MKLDIVNIIIISSRAGDKNVSSWIDHLCLKRIFIAKIEFLIRIYEILCDAEPYYDERERNFLIPPIIDGKITVGIEDGYIVGGDLVSIAAEIKPFYFHKNSPEVAKVWLKDMKWYVDKEWGVISNILVNS